MEKLKLEDTLACAMHSSHVLLHSQLLKPSLPSSKASRFSSLLMQTCRHTHTWRRHADAHSLHPFMLQEREHPASLSAQVHSYSHTHHAAPTYTFGNIHTMKPCTYTHKQVHLQEAVTEAHCPGGPFGNEHAREPTCMQAGAWWARLSCSGGLSRSHHPAATCTHRDSIQSLRIINTLSDTATAWSANIHFSVHTHWANIFSSLI